MRQKRKQRPGNNQRDADIDADSDTDTDAHIAADVYANTADVNVDDFFRRFFFEIDFDSKLCYVSGSMIWTPGSPSHFNRSLDV